MNIKFNQRVCVIVMLFAFQAFCQVDSISSIEREILNFEDPKDVIISRGRNLLLEKFIENDISKVKEIKDYLIEEVKDENYMVLHLSEYWLILYWTNEYEELLHSITTYSSVRYNYVFRFPQDMLEKRLLLQSRENAKQITSQIQNSTINTEQKKFLQLYFEFLINREDAYQDSLNMQADSFLEMYPETEYKEIVKQQIRYKLIPGSWRIAFEFFSGYGIFTGTLSDNYTNNIPIGFASDICYKRFELYLRGYLGLHFTKKDLGYSTGIYEKGSPASAALLEASLGYAVFDNNRFKISPFLGIGTMEISPPTDKIPELKEISLEFTTTYLMGLNFDIKLDKADYLFSPSESYTFLRIRYGYSIPRFSKKYNGISGDMHYITIGYGVFLRGLKRDD